MQFYYVYKSLAHPEHNGYVQPFTLDERLMHVAEAKRTLGSDIPWLCDTMANDLKHALGDAPNSEFVIDPEGRVARNRTWSDPGQLRKDLEELIGPVDLPTQVADLNMKSLPAPQPAAKGILPRVPRPQGAVALKVEPVLQDGGDSFYVKLRAEAQRSVLSGGSGKLYLGFHLDPLYHVHWNNLTPPIRVTLAPPETARVSETVLNGPKLEAEGDSDPREFLIDAADVQLGQTMRVAVSYFACNDEEGWCKPVAQEYAVRFEADADGGWVRGAGRPNAGVATDERPRPGRRRNVGRQVEMGRVVRVDPQAGAVVIRTPDGSEQTYHIIHNGATLRIRGGPGKIDDLSPGDGVRFQWQRTERGRAILRLMVRD